MTAPMLETLDVAPAALKWTEAGGLSLQRIVKLDSLDDPELHDAAAILAYGLTLFAEDPRAYSQTLTTQVGAALSTLSGGRTYPTTYPYTYASSGGGTVSVTNAGNRPTPPVFRVYGGCTNPSIVLAGGPRIVLNGTIASGDYLEVGTDSRGNRTIKLFTPGASVGVNRHNFYDGAQSQWFELPKETTSTIQMVAGAFDGSAHVEVLFRSAYA